MFNADPTKIPGRTEVLANCEQFLFLMKDTHRITHIYRQGR